MKAEFKQTKTSDGLPLTVGKKIRCNRRKMQERI